MDSFIQKAIEIRMQMAVRTIETALEYSIGARHGIEYRDVHMRDGSDFIYATLIDREGEPAVSLRAHPLERKWDTYMELDPYRVITVVQAIDLLDCVIDSSSIDEDMVNNPLRHFGRKVRFSDYSHQSTIKV